MQKCPHCRAEGLGWVSEIIYEFDTTEGAGERMDGYFKCVYCGFVEYPPPPKPKPCKAAQEATFRNGGIALSAYDFGEQAVVVRKRGGRKPKTDN